MRQSLRLPRSRHIRSLRSNPCKESLLTFSMLKLFSAPLAFLLIQSPCPVLASSSSSATTQTVIHEILTLLLERQTSKPDLPRPYVTLSFAQSLDGQLAPFTSESRNDGAKTRTPQANYPLSGAESLVLTHAIRSIHDGILVGGRTFSIDNPRLTNRLYGDKQLREQHQPRPVVLDPSLQHIQKLSSDTIRAERRLIVLFSDQLDPGTAEKCKAAHTNCELVPCPALSDNKLDLEHVLWILKEQFGMQSLMVEGGAQVLSSFLDHALFDSICITIAPCWIGPGIGLTLRAPVSLDFKESPIVYKNLGNDLILLI